jgi:hypothetical protein
MSTQKWSCQKCLEQKELLMTVEFTKERFPKYRKVKEKSHGELGRVFAKLKECPQRLRDGNIKTLANEVVEKAFKGF